MSINWAEAPKKGLISWLVKTCAKCQLRAFAINNSFSYKDLRSWSCVGIVPQDSASRLAACLGVSVADLTEHGIRLVEPRKRGDERKPYGSQIGEPEISHDQARNLLDSIAASLEVSPELLAVSLVINVMRRAGQKKRSMLTGMFRREIAPYLKRYAAMQKNKK